jgi:hypothetical protein
LIITEHGFNLLVPVFSRKTRFQLTDVTHHEEHEVREEKLNNHQLKLVG